MAPMDWVYLGILLFGGFLGYRKGLLMEVVNVLAFVLAIIGAFKLLDHGIVWLTNQYGEPHPMIPFLSFVGIFVAIVLGVNILGKAIKKVLHLTPLGWIDRLFGVLLGLLKWAFGLSLILWLLAEFAPGVSENMSAGSSFYPYLMPLSTKVLSVLAGLFPFLDQFMEHVSAYLQT